MNKIYLKYNCTTAARVASGLEKSGKFDIFSRSGNCQGILKIGQWKNKNPQKSGKSQGKIILKDTFFQLLLHVLAMAVFLHWIFNWKVFIMIIFHNCKIKQTL